MLGQMFPNLKNTDAFPKTVLISLAIVVFEKKKMMDKDGIKKNFPLSMPINRAYLDNIAEATDK